MRSYYDLVTDLYEEGWAQSFHFCRFAVNEGFLQALARHEHYMALKLHLDQGMKVLDVGCGVGRPAREIAAFTGCNVVGLNNNGYQIERATNYAKQEGLDDLVSFVKGDFMVRYCLPPALNAQRLMSIGYGLPREHLRRRVCHGGHRARSNASGRV
jgi:sterol 24-C-methyltransferase